MSEMQPSQNNVENVRPIGRFLLQLDGFPSQHGVFVYASKFAADYRDILNSSWYASRVSVEEINGRRVELEFAADYTNDEYAWHVVAGDEQYEIHTNGNETYGTYYEFTPQRSVLRRRSITTPEDLEVLQGIVEHMTGTLEFHKNASAIRGDKTRTHANINELSDRPRRTRGESKDLNALRGHLSLAGFPVGSRDISGMVPLSSDN